MVKRIFLIITLILAVTTSNAAAKTIDNIVSGYKSWNEIGMDGKLKMDGIPLGIKPSLKIYMLKDSVIRVSISAPFKGQVAVMEIDTDKILVVNKMNNRYSTVSMNDVYTTTGMSVGNFQDILLAQMFSVGYDKVNQKNFEVFNDETNAMTAIVPKKQTNNYSYGFVFDNSQHLLCTLFATSIGTLTFNYTYGKKQQTDIQIMIESDYINKDATLEINSITYSPKALEPFVVTSKYTKVSPAKLF